MWLQERKEGENGRKVNVREAVRDGMEDEERRKEVQWSRKGNLRRVKERCGEGGKDRRGDAV